MEGARVSGVCWDHGHHKRRVERACMCTVHTTIENIKREVRNMANAMGQEECMTCAVLTRERVMRACHIDECVALGMSESLVGKSEQRKWVKEN
jgi:hypothetical protein